MTAPDPAAIPQAELAWLPCHRLIASRFPTVGLYDGIARPEDLDVIFAIEALTNPRIRQEIGQLSLVPPADRVSGPGASLIMAAFTHLNPEGSRFSDGGYGVYYAANNRATAIAEVSHHRARFLARTAEPAIDIDLRWIRADLQQRVHDIRRGAANLGADTDVGADAFADFHHPEHYGASQALGRALRQAGSPALTYDSVRCTGGQCVAVFAPRALANAKPAGHLSLHWDGHRITHWFDKGEPHAAAPQTISPDPS